MKIDEVEGKVKEGRGGGVGGCEGEKVMERRYEGERHASSNSLGNMRARREQVKATMVPTSTLCLLTGPGF